MGDKETTLRAAAQALVGKSYVRGPLRITVTKPAEVDEHGRLVVWVSATRDAQPLVLDLPFIYVNPPMAVRLADDSIKVDHLLALKDIVADTVNRF